MRVQLANFVCKSIFHTLPLLLIAMGLQEDFQQAAADAKEKLPENLSNEDKVRRPVALSRLAKKMCCAVLRCERLEALRSSFHRIDRTVLAAAQLILYGLFKQANEGDVTTAKPGIFDPKARGWAAPLGCGQRSDSSVQRSLACLVTRRVAQSGTTGRRTKGKQRSRRWRNTLCERGRRIEGARIRLQRRRQTIVLTTFCLFCCTQEGRASRGVVRAGGCGAGVSVPECCRRGALTNRSLARIQTHYMEQSHPCTIAEIELTKLDALLTNWTRRRKQGCHPGRQ